MPGAADRADAPAPSGPARPRVSILVPSYNHAAYLPRRLASIFDQGVSDIEVLVIDDASFDDSGEVLQDLQRKFAFTLIRNPRNSGTPFAAWSAFSAWARGQYFWICESDDFAEPDFLAQALANLEAVPDAALYYCNSWVVDEADRRIGDTSEYFTKTWRETRWDRAFVNAGRPELADFQQRGQIVPNMSSALIEAEAFRQALTPLLTRFKLCGDWLFIGRVLPHGKVIFDPARRSNFRKHEVTARVRVQSARSQAEFILTKFLLSRLAHAVPTRLADLLAIDIYRFFIEDARWHQVLRAMLRVSWLHTARCGLMLGYAFARKPGVWRRLLARGFRRRGD